VFPLDLPLLAPAARSSLPPPLAAMGVNPETLPLGGNTPAPTRPLSYTVSLVLAALLVASAALNVAQLAGVSTSHQTARLGFSYGAKPHTFQTLNVGPRKSCSPRHRM